MKGRVLIQDLAIHTIVGILPREREVEQQLLLDIEMEVDFTKPAFTEDVHTTVDYAAVSSDLTDFVRERKFLLVETLAVEACSRILERHELVTWCGIRVKKPAAVPSAAYVGVAFSLARSAGG